MLGGSIALNGLFGIASARQCFGLMVVVLPARLELALPV